MTTVTQANVRLQLFDMWTIIDLMVEHFTR